MSGTPGFRSERGFSFCTHSHERLSGYSQTTYTPSKHPNVTPSLIMARDRLATLRAQQQASYSDRWSYPSQIGAGYSEPDRPPNTYTRTYRPTTMYEQPDIQYVPKVVSGEGWSYPSPGGMAMPEICHTNKPNIHHNTHYNIPSAQRVAPSVEYSQEDMSMFYSEISSTQDNLRTFNDNVSRISDLHSRSLNSMDWATSRRMTHQLDGLVKETSTLSNTLKDQIKKLHTVRVSGRDGQIRIQQIGLVKHKFIEAIHNYQQVEQAYRSKYKQRMERQYRVVNPDATTEEVKAVINDEQDGQLFALQFSNRYGPARAAFREVQERYEDVKNMERTLTELAQLFNDMQVLVMRDGEVIDGIQAMTGDIEKHTEVGLRQTTKAVASARAARKQCLCIGTSLIVVVCFAIVIAVLAAQLSNNNN